MQMIHNIWLHLGIVFLPRNTKNLQISAFTSGMESNIAWWKMYNDHTGYIYNDGGTVLNAGNNSLDIAHS